MLWCNVPPVKVMRLVQYIACLKTSRSYNLHSKTQSSQVYGDKVWQLILIFLDWKITTTLLKTLKTHVAELFQTINSLSSNITVCIRHTHTHTTVNHSGGRSILYDISFLQCQRGIAMSQHGGFKLCLHFSWLTKSCEGVCMQICMRLPLCLSAVNLFVLWYLGVQSVGRVHVLQALCFIWKSCCRTVLKSTR